MHEGFARFIDLFFLSTHSVQTVDDRVSLPFRNRHLSLINLLSHRFSSFNHDAHENMLFRFVLRFCVFLVMHADAIVREVLPPELHTSPGWRNEILPSMPIPYPRVNRPNFVYSGNNFVQTNRANFVQQRNLNEQEIIRRVEQAQVPPVIVRRKLPNNLVTYQQNIAVKYLQPPPLPPPGPLIIRTNDRFLL